jgi:hypothetical protein
MGRQDCPLFAAAPAWSRHIKTYGYYTFTNREYLPYGSIEARDDRCPFTRWHVWGHRKCEDNPIAWMRRAGASTPVITMPKMKMG